MLEMKMRYSVTKTHIAWGIGKGIDRDSMATSSVMVFRVVAGRGKLGPVGRFAGFCALQFLVHRSHLMIIN